MKVAVIMAVLMAAASLVCLAADIPTISLDANNTPIEQVVSDISSQTGVQVVCDTGVEGSVTGQFPAVELETLLNVITKSNGLTWIKLYIPVQTDRKPTLTEIKARAKAVEAITGGAIAVLDPITGKQRVYIEQDPKAPSVDPDKLGLKPLYLISKPKVESKDEGQSKVDAGTRLASLYEERIKLLSQMTPEQRVAALQMETQQEMVYMMQADPTTRQQMLLDQMNARRNMDPALRDEYRRITREAYRTLRDQGLMPDWGRDRRNRN